MSAQSPADSDDSADISSIIAGADMDVSSGQGIGQLTMPLPIHYGDEEDDGDEDDDLEPLPPFDDLFSDAALQGLPANTSNRRRGRPSTASSSSSSSSSRLARGSSSSSGAHHHLRDGLYNNGDGAFIVVAEDEGGDRAGSVTSGGCVRGRGSSNKKARRTPMGLQAAMDLSLSKEPVVSSGRWTTDEHQLFLEGVMLYGRSWKKIKAIVKTRR
jgi:Myb-like DNA-binding domain